MVSGGEERLTLGEAFPDILRAARGGAPWAFERLYANLAPAVAGYLRMRGAAETEDLVSEVFLGVFRGLDKFEGSERQFRSWVFTIAHRRLLDERRRRARRPHLQTMDGATGTPGGDVEREALEALGLQRAVALCAQLSNEQRSVLLLRHVADLSVEEVARITGKTTGAVKALQRRALHALRRRVVRECAPL